MVLSFVPQTPCRTSETNMWSVKKQNKKTKKKHIHKTPTGHKKVCPSEQTTVLSCCTLSLFVGLIAPSLDIYYTDLSILWIPPQDGEYLSLIRPDYRCLTSLVYRWDPLKQLLAFASLSVNCIWDCVCYSFLGLNLD